MKPFFYKIKNKDGQVFRTVGISLYDGIGNYLEKSVDTQTKNLFKNWGETKHRIITEMCVDIKEVKAKN